MKYLQFSRCEYNVDYMYFTSQYFENHMKTLSQQMVRHLKKYEGRFKFSETVNMHAGLYLYCFQNLDLLFLDIVSVHWHTFFPSAVPFLKER